MIIPLLTGIIAGSYNVSGTLYTSWNGYTDCSLNVPVTKYTGIGVNLGTGATLYNNTSLTIPFTNGYFYYSGIVYPTDGSGVVGAGSICPTLTQLYSDCNLNSLTYIGRTSAAFATGEIVYSDDQLTTPITNASFYFGPSARAGSTDGSGVVSFGAYCYNTYTTYSDCISTSPTTVYGFYNRTLSAGEYVFTDSSLSTQLANTTFVYLNRRLTTNSNGYIADQSPATCPAYITSVYTTCDKNTVQATLRSIDPLGDLVTVYTDDALNNTYSNQSFVYGTPPKQYNTSIGGVMDSGTFCVRTWGSYTTCDNERDSVNAVDYYTRYPDATLQVGVVVYSDNTATTTLASATFIKNGTIYTTDGSGSINSTSSCYYSIPTANTCGGVHNSGYVITNSTATNAVGLYNAGAIIYGSYPTPLTNATVYVAGDTHYIMTNSSGVAATLIQCTT